MALYAFVAGISASPTIIQHLDNQAPLSVVAGVELPEANRRVSSSGSSARNGDTIAQMSYGDGTFTIPLEFANKTTAEYQSETIQKLSRILDGESWLLWKPDGVISPSFFRVRYGTMQIQTDIEDETPERSLVLNLVVEYASYGLPVSGTATINNTPIAATNPMSYVFPAIQGDVATPLWLSYMQPSGAHHPMIASLSDADVSGMPKRIDINTGTIPGPSGFGSTIASVTDSAYVNSNLRRISNGGVSVINVQGAWAGNITFRPGDYRILIRAKQSTTERWIIRLGLDAGLYSSTAIDTLLPATTAVSWFDLGVVRIPLGAPPASPLRSRPSVPCAVTVGARGTFTTGATLDLDEVLFVPVGFDSSPRATYAVLASSVSNGSDSPRQIEIDGESTTAYTIPQTGDSGSQAVSVAGGFPSVTPGLSNIMHFIPALAEGAAAITGTSAISWSYYPRYLYIRPATT